MAEDPQAPSEQRRAARHLVQQPLTAQEHDPDLFRLIRRHEADLDRWFTQRLGYRLHVGGDTARLHKTGYVPVDRPLRTGTGRALHQLEYVLLTLILASTAAGPAIISLRDLIEQVRSAAAEADIPMGDGVADRRALVAALKWMIDHGLAAELHAKVDTYATDEEADAVLRIRPDRIALLPLPALVGAATADELLDRADRRSATRQWMRARLVEDPVLYRSDLDDAEWAELRRRLGDEERIVEEMFGLTLESRAEGVAAVDPAGTLADQRFPAGGTVGHAALLLLEALRPDPTDGGPGTNAAAGNEAVPADHAVAGNDAGAGHRPVVPMTEVRAHLAELVDRHRRRWANHLVDAPDRLTNHVIRLLVDLRLAEEVQGAGPTESAADTPSDGAVPTGTVPTGADAVAEADGMDQADAVDRTDAGADAVPEHSAVDQADAGARSAAMDQPDAVGQADAVATDADAVDGAGRAGRAPSGSAAAPSTEPVIGLRLLPAAGRFLAVTPDATDEAPAPPQDSLW